MRVSFVVRAIWLFFPFFLPLVNCVFGSIVSRVSVVVPTGCRSVAYLASFVDVASRIDAIELWHLVFGVYILHPKFACSTIRPHTPRTRHHASACDEFFYRTYLSILSPVFKVWPVDAFPGSENLKSFVAPLHPSYLPSFPIDINYSLRSHNRLDRFKKISFNKRKAQGHLPLK
jgi:hypothetical protein